MSGGYTDITIVIDNKSDEIIAVKVNGDLKQGKDLSHGTLAETYKITPVLICHEKDESPCCIIINNKEYCWC